MPTGLAFETAYRAVQEDFLVPTDHIAALVESYVDKVCTKCDVSEVKQAALAVRSALRTYRGTRKRTAFGMGADRRTEASKTGLLANLELLNIAVMAIARSNRNMAGFVKQTTSGDRHPCGRPPLLVDQWPQPLGEADAQ